MDESNTSLTMPSMRTPRAAAIAGIAFSLMFGAALILIRIAVPANPDDAGAWLEDGWRNSAVKVALYLVPFAGLAFLWFIGVIRDRVGAAEDRLFSTVFLGTGLLFVGMLFVAAAAGAALLEAAAPRRRAYVSEDVWNFGRHSSYIVLTVYAMRMAGAFAIVTTTIGTRLGLFPRWLTAFGWIVAVILLITVQSFAWAVMLFPVWVLVLSVYFLIHEPAGQQRTDTS
jgi:hypothetical protein